MSSIHGDLAPRVRLRPGLVGVGFLMVCGVAVAAQPAPPQVPAESHPPMAAQSPLTLDRAVALAEQHFKARVVRASEEEAEGHHVYVLRLLSEEGRVWTVRVDAQTGVMN
jgi:uncharacterized membrane protein YkoI